MGIFPFGLHPVLPPVSAARFGISDVKALVTDSFIIDNLVFGVAFGIRRGVDREALPV